MWFSSMVKRLCLVEGRGVVSEEESVIVFRAVDISAAKGRIVEISRNLEEGYLNGDGEKVRWTVSDIITLDWLEGSADLPDAREVYSRIKDLPVPDDSVAFDAAYDLSATRPAETGV